MRLWNCSSITKSQSTTSTTFPIFASVAKRCCGLRLDWTSQAPSPPTAARNSTLASELRIGFHALCFDEQGEERRALGVMIAVTYGYVRVSKADDGSKNLETQLRELATHGIRRELIFTDEASGRTMDRPGWRNLMARVQPGDTIVVAFLDRFSRNFEEGVAIQADLTTRDIAIVAIREQIDTREGSAAANFFRQAMLAQGAYQVESASERIRMGLERAPDAGRRIGRPPALSPDQVEQCRRMAEERASQRQIARVLGCSPTTVKKALEASGNS